MNKEKLREKVTHIRPIFEQLYGEATCSLDYKVPHELLISTILAAQCTDARVNIVGQTLYKKYRSIEDFAAANLDELMQDIYATGFYRNKAKNIIACCQMLLSEYGGKVPDKMEELLKLPGVGRKTANLVLGDIYGIPGLVIDTHAKRLCNRIGLVHTEDVTKIEFELMDIVPKDYWSQFCHQLVYHGRAICDARKPKCGECPIAMWCDHVNITD